MGLSSVDLFVRPAIWTASVLDLRHEPEDDPTLLFPGIIAHGTLQALFRPGKIGFGYCAILRHSMDPTNASLEIIGAL